MEYLETGLEVHVPETHLEQETEMDRQDTPEDIAEREGIHERIQAELHNEDIEKVPRRRRCWNSLRCGTRCKI